MGVNLLIVDDDAALCKLLQSLLVKRDCTIQVAGTVAEARRMMSEQDFDLALVDGLLPDGVGLDLIAEHRNLGAKTDFIFMSAHWRHVGEYIELTRKLSVSAVVHKPFASEEMLVHVDAAIERATAMEQPTAPEAPADPFQQALAELRNKYAATLGERLDQLDKELAALEQEPDADNIESSLRLAHKLHGTSGTYGFMEISVATGMIEEQLGALKAGDIASQPMFWRRLREAAHRARRAVPDLDVGSAKGSEALEDLDHERAVHASTILVVDDDPAFLEQIKVIGRATAHRVLTAVGRDDALQIANEEMIDSAMIDIGLGEGIDGFELAAELREQPGLASLPLGIVSVADNLESRLRAAWSGASLFAGKPVDKETFEQMAIHLHALARGYRPKVLVVDDDPDFSAFVATVLRRHGILVAELHEPERILEALLETRPDLALIDIVMPILSGFDLVRIIRTSPEWKDLPLLLATAQSSHESRLAAFEAGADDYIAKPIIERELIARIKLRVERLSLQRERQERDALTGLLRRQAFMDRFGVRMAELRRHGGRAALCLLDLDHFKQINDSRGHLVGDRVLAAFGRFLTARYRVEDLRCRWGGEEFVMVLLEQDLEMARALIQRGIEDFSQRAFVDDRGEPFSVAFSAGVAAWPDDGDDVTALIERADERLYQAKDAGRARVV